MILIFKITNGVLPVTANLLQSGIIIDTQICNAYLTEYMFTAPDGIYTLELIDSLGCLAEADIDTEITTTTTTSTTSTTTTLYVCSIDVEILTTTTTTTEISTTTTTTTDFPAIQRGALYNWYAITDEREITSSGWRVPEGDDWNTLITYCGGLVGNSGKLKEVSLVYWDDISDATNEYGMNVRGAGYRYEGGFYGIGVVAAISMTDINIPAQETSMMYLTGGYPDFFFEVGYLYYGCSCRPIKTTTTLSHGQTGTYVGNNGRVYRTICIGTQEWVADNLWETKFRNGEDIPLLVTDNSTWNALTSAAMCYYNDDINNA